MPPKPAAPADEFPEDMPPPVVSPEPAAAAVKDADLEATGRMAPVEPAAEPELDPRELKALSRQERKQAKAAQRREQQEARNAARQAKAMAKAAAKVSLAAPAATEASASAAEVEPEVPSSEAKKPAVDEDLAGDEPTPEAVEPIEPIEPDAPSSDGDDDTWPSAAEPTDPRARAAQRVQRRLGKDAEKLSAAEARARARQEAKRRRAQAKEQRSGVAAEEAVVRPPDEPTEGNLTEDVSVVEMAGHALEAEPVIEEPVIDEVVNEAAVDEELVASEPVAEEPVEEDVVDDVLEQPEPDLPEPVAEQRIDEPSPVGTPRSRGSDVAEQIEPEPQTREISKVTPTTLPMDGDEERKSRLSLAPVAGVVGLIALGISVLLAVGALLVALGFDSGGLYEALRTVANLLVGPLEGAFDFSGANAERKEHFLAWGAGSIGYLLISFVGQAVQRANDDD